MQTIFCISVSETHITPARARTTKIRTAKKQILKVTHLQVLMYCFKQSNLCLNVYNFSFLSTENTGKQRQSCLKGLSLEIGIYGNTITERFFLKFLSP